MGEAAAHGLGNGGWYGGVRGAGWRVRRADGPCGRYRPLADRQPRAARRRSRVPGAEPTSALPARARVPKHREAAKFSVRRSVGAAPSSRSAVRGPPSVDSAVHFQRGETVQRTHVLSVVAMSLVLALGANSSVVRDSEPSQSPPSNQRAATDYELELFLAVLEGLYEDGVSNDAVDAITVIDSEHGYPANFVWACPVCMPAYRAFLTYRARPEFTWIKGSPDFGPGLTAEQMAGLTTGEFSARQEALMKLVGCWVERRMARLRLTPEENAAWQREMEQRRKKGMAQLAAYKDQRLGGSYARMNDCPLCDGANEPWLPPTRGR